MIGSKSFFWVAVIFDFDSRRRLRKGESEMNWVSIRWKNDVGEEGRKHQSSPACPRPRPSLLWLVPSVFASLPKIILKRFSDVPWISNMTENDFIWFYFQKIEANQLSAKVAMTPFHKLPKDISVSFQTNRFFAFFSFVLWTFCVWKQLQRKWFEVLVFTSIAKPFGYP